MFYVDFDAGWCAFLGPRDDFDENQIDNRALIAEVEDIVSHVARNQQAKVFEPRVLESASPLARSRASVPGRAGRSRQTL